MGNSAAKSSAGVVETAAERRERHDVILRGYRVPASKWQSVTAEFVTDSAKNLATNDNCAAIYAAQETKSHGVDVLILYNRDKKIGPKQGITRELWPQILAEFDKRGFLSILCTKDNNADEYCFRRLPNDSHWFWHIDRRPPQTPQTPQTRPTQAAAHQPPQEKKTDMAKTDGEQKSDGEKKPEMPGVKTRGARKRGGTELPEAPQQSKRQKHDARQPAAAKPHIHTSEFASLYRGELVEAS